MRSPVLVWSCLVALVGCGDNDGAVLSFATPDGPITATRIEIILASASPHAISTLSNQRARPGGLMSEDVVYYKQRATAGELAVTSLDGYTLRIAPDQDVADDEAFIPFALVYDHDTLTGIGAVHDASGAPSAVTIRPGMVVEYAMTVTPIAEVGDVALTANTGRVVHCFDRSEAASGVAWRPGTGTQLRLLFPDRDADPDATDATDRALDLDCDQHDATASDCDDLRAAYFHGQTETCDGLDTDCDGKLAEVIPGCSLAAGTCGGQGVSYCAEGPLTNSFPPVTSTCQPDVACACAPDSGLACARCVLDYTTSNGSGQRLCAPALGKIHPQGMICEASQPCRVTIAQIDGPFEVKLAAEEVGPWQGNIMTTNSYVHLRATYLPGTAVTVPGGTALGAVHLVVYNANNTIAPFPVQLELAETGDGSCALSPITQETWMTCTP